jgi:hypothetical protein
MPTNAFVFEVYWTPACLYADVRNYAATPLAAFEHTTSQVDLEIDLKYYYSDFPVHCPVYTYITIKESTESTF